MIFLLPQEEQRNTTLTHAAYTMGKKVGGGLLDEDVAREILAELGTPWGLDQEETDPYPSEDDLNEYGPGLFFSQWLEQMEEKPGESTKEDTLYMAYHRYCEYYRECPLTLTGFRQGMDAHSIDSRPDISQGNVNVYDGITIPASFHTAMYGEPIF